VADNQFSQLNLNQQTAKPTASMMNLNPTVGPGQSVGPQFASNLAGASGKQLSQFNSNQQTVGPQFASQLGQQNVGLSGLLGVTDNQFLNLNQQTVGQLNPHFQTTGLKSGQANHGLGLQFNLSSASVSQDLQKQFSQLNLNLQTRSQLNPQVLNMGIGEQSGQLQTAGLQSGQAIQGLGQQFNVFSANDNQLNLSNYSHTAQQKSPFSQDLLDLPNHLQNISLEQMLSTSTDFQVPSQAGQHKSQFSAAIEKPKPGQIGNQGKTSANVPNTGLQSGISEANLGFGLKPDLPNASLSEDLQKLPEYLQNFKMI